MFPPMDTNEALERLLRVSEDIRAAVVFEPGGDVHAATLPDDDARELAALGDAMLVYADTLRDSAEVRQLDIVTPEGGVYLVRDGELAALAIASPGALVGLVQYDLRTLLGSLKRPRRKEKASAVP
jgi:predicted regulator of Ras-like GTPase activity (Roadblock/LC7/MglB family)